MEHDHVNIAVLDANTTGFERVPARRLADGNWELLSSPLYALHVAAGDVIRVLDPNTGAFEILTRGGNVVVQLYLGERDADDAQVTAKAAAEIAPDIATLGGAWMLRPRMSKIAPPLTASHSAATAEIDGRPGLSDNPGRTT